MRLNLFINAPGGTSRDANTETRPETPIGDMRRRPRTLFSHEILLCMGLFRRFSFYPPPLAGVPIFVRGGHCLFDTNM
jgi:hypothetical protein